MAYRDRRSYALSKKGHFDLFWPVFDIQCSKNIYYSALNIPGHFRTYVSVVIKAIKALDLICIGSYEWGKESGEESEQNEVISPQTRTM